MICPHCKRNIPDRTVARHLASKAGRAGSSEAKRRAGQLGGLAKARAAKQEKP